MPELQILLFGPPRVEYGGETIRMNKRKSLALLAYLGVTAAAHSRDALSTLLWPESDPTSSRVSLRQTLSDLRRNLGDGYLITDRQNVALNWAADIGVDVREFEGQLTAFRNHGHSDDTVCSECEPLLHKAVALCRGEFLAGHTLRDSASFDEWQLFQAEYLRRRLATTLEKLVIYHGDRQEYVAALDYARRWLAQDLLHESAHRALMRLYVAMGQPSAALRQYASCVQALAKELNVPPTEETTALHDAIRQSPTRSVMPTAPDHLDTQLRHGPAYATDPVTPHNLPAQIHPLIGRAEEIKEVFHLLDQPDCRLLTIVGAGGMGKSSLALTVARRRLEHCPDGVFHVSLAGTPHADLLPAAIADALDLTQAIVSGDTQRERLFNFLRTKSALLILDNFEHLEAGAVFLSDLLQHTQHLKLLVTSRVRLNLQDEWLFPLVGLAFPDTSTAETTGGYAAMELFAHAASRLRPAFSLDDEWPDVAAICRLAEGMPLAIELASTWVRVMSCAEIVAELQRDLGFLSAAPRDAAPQHQSLRAVFLQSWRQLSEPQQRILRRLAVFRGGFTRTAAEEVTDATHIALAHLIDRSLIRRQPSGRFDMHALMRQFAAEQLAQDPVEQEQTLARHCTHYARRLSGMYWFLAVSEKKILLGQEIETYRQIVADIDNVRTAWQWAVVHKDWTALRQMMNTLAYHYLEYGGLEEGRQAFDAAVAAFALTSTPPSDIDAGIVGSLLLRRAWLTRPEWGDETYFLCRQSIELLRRAGRDSQEDLALGLQHSSSAALHRGVPEQCSELLAEALAIFRQLDHGPGIGYILRHQGLMAYTWGRPGLAERALSEALTQLELFSEPLAVVAQHWLGIAYMLQGRYRQAEEMMKGALARLQRGQPSQSAAYILRNLGDLKAAMGDLPLAQAYFANAAAQFKYVGHGWEDATALVWSPGDIARVLGDFAEAERLISSALDATRHLRIWLRVATNLYRLGKLRGDQGQHIEAETLLHEALSLAREIDYRFGVAQFLCQLGQTEVALNRTELARTYYAEALQIAQDESIDRLAVDTVVGIAGLLAADDHVEDAVGILALAEGHSASDYETKKKARYTLAQLMPRLSPDVAERAIAQGKSADLHTVIADLILAGAGG